MTKVIRAKFELLPVEEVANAITHGFGLFLSVIGFIALLAMAAIRGGRLSWLSCLVYGLSLIVLYTASTVYHSATSPRFKKNLQIVDHCCIYLLIAGSYTPFGLVIADGTIGRNLLIAFWAIAIVGILIKLVIRDRFPAINVISYLAMGWLGVFAVGPLFDALGTAPVVLAIAGGIAYSLGVVFFPMKFIKHHHAIFHVFVLLGSIIHYAAIIMYIVPHTTNL